MSQSYDAVRAGKFSPEELKSLHQKALQEDPRAQLALAILFEQGINPHLPSCPLSAFEWYSMAARNGNAVAHCALARIYAKNSENAANMFNYCQLALIFSRINHDGQSGLFIKLIKLRLKSAIASRPRSPDGVVFSTTTRGGKHYSAMWHRGSNVFSLIPL